MVIDVLFLIFAGWGFYQGYSRGIIKTVLYTFSIVFGLMAAFKLAPAATRFIETAFHSNSAFNFIAGFLLAFVLSMLIVRLIASFFTKLVQTANINIVNQFAGGILISSLYTLLFSLMIWFGDKSHIITQQTSQESMSYPFLKAFPSKMKVAFDYVAPSFREFWQESVKFMDKVQEKSVERTESQPTIFDIPDEEEKKEAPPDSGDAKK